MRTRCADDVGWVGVLLHVFETDDRFEGGDGRAC